MMNREDLLRELELLPVWQLRKPIAGVISTASELRSTQTEMKAQNEAQDKLQQPLRLIVSADNEWLFLLNQVADEAAEQLLQNIFKAIGISVGQDTHLSEKSQLSEFQTKVMMVMGESVAQQILNDKQAIGQLRGTTHRLMETPVVVTYSVEHLLTNLPDKAVVWEDLCLAKLTIANL